MIERPHLIDREDGEIHAIRGGRTIRSWTYCDEDFRAKWKEAREFVEGWHQALEAIAGRAA